MITAVRGRIKGDASMSTLSQIVFLVLAFFIGWQTYRFVKHHPGFFSREYLGRSIFSLGILALLLIGFVTVLVMIAKSM